jgi:predicted nuclease with TOPRIM domain
MQKTEYGELIEFLGVKFGKIDERFKKIDDGFVAIDDRFEKLESRMGKLEAKLDDLPTKTYIDEKIASLWAIDVKEDQKVNRLAEMLKNNRVITEDQFSELGKYKLFP